MFYYIFIKFCGNFWGFVSLTIKFWWGFFMKSEKNPCFVFVCKIRRTIHSLVVQFFRVLTVFQRISLRSKWVWAECGKCVYFIWLYGKTIKTKFWTKSWIEIVHLKPCGFSTFLIKIICLIIMLTFCLFCLFCLLYLFSLIFWESGFCWIIHKLSHQKVFSVEPHLICALANIPTFYLLFPTIELTFSQLKRMMLVVGR